MLNKFNIHKFNITINKSYNNYKKKNDFIRVVFVHLSYFIFKVKILKSFFCDIC